MPTGKLLRVRKQLPTTIPCREAQELWERNIRPKFLASEIVHQSLVHLRPINGASQLNRTLRIQELSDTGGLLPRPRGRRGVYLAMDDYGLLITDMSNLLDEDDKSRLK